MTELRVSFAALENMRGAIEQSIEAVEDGLGALDEQVRWLSQVWDGAAAAGFQRTAADWASASRDLRDQLALLHQLVTNAYDNHAAALRTNINMWRV